jgi:hypothetical protein
MKTPSPLLSRFSIAGLLLLLSLHPAVAAEAASGDAYAAFVRESASKAKNAASERLRRVEEAKAAFRDNRQQALPRGDANQGAQEETWQVDSRAVTQAALLAVYDANGNGWLDDDELARIRNDRIRAASPSSASVARWKRMEERIAANKNLSAEEKARILESIRRRMDEEEKKEKARRGK